MQKRQLVEIKNNAGSLLREVQSSGEDLLVEENGEEIAVVVSMDRYRSTIQRSREAIRRFATEARRRAESVPDDQLEADIAEAIREVRAAGKEKPRGKQ